MPNKNLIAFLLCIISCYPVYAQTNDSWIAFYNKDSTLTGFKDAAGAIRIRPKFSTFTVAEKFDYIIAATEEENDKWRSYYLTRTGKTVAQDSLYIFDNTPDCEHEGFIRFSDHTTDRKGLLNRNGAIAVPAVYNDLSKVRNGLIIALNGAETIMEENGEHASYKGGSTSLIDTLNNLLIQDFPFNDDINFYSLNITAQPADDTLLHKSFKATDGRYYIFEDYEKEFEHWLKTIQQNGISKEKFAGMLFQQIITWQDEKGWINETPQLFAERNFTPVKQRLARLNDSTCTYDISDGQWSLFNTNTPVYNRYQDNCGNLMYWRYPCKNLTITDKNKREQDQFLFLRTEDGYKLVSVSLAGRQLK